MCARRNRILQDIDRFIHPEQVINRVVYSLDDTAFVSAADENSDESTYTPPPLQQLGNFDEQKWVALVEPLAADSPE